MFSSLSAIVLSSLVLLISHHLPTARASTCTGGDIALQSPRVTVGSDGSLTLTGQIKFASSSAGSDVTAAVRALGRSADLDVDLCKDVTCSDTSEACPCTSWSEIALNLGEKIPEQYAQYIPSGFSISASADIYQEGQLLTSCSVGVRSASASFVSVGAVVVLLGLGGGAGLLARRRRRRRIAMEAEGDGGNSNDGGPSSSFVEMADGRVAGEGAVMA